MSRRVLLIGTLDTKGAEYDYVRRRIRERGHEVLVMDLGVLGEPAFTPDVTATDVARAGGGDLAALRTAGDRGAAIEVMLSGACALVAEMHADDRFDGVMGLGGGGGTAMITAAMRRLPVGVPKVMVSTMGSGDTAPYVGVKDVTMMYSVTDIAGLNRLSRRILTNAAGALCGMVEMLELDAELAGAEGDGAPGDGAGSGDSPERPIVAATMFGVTTPCVDAVRERIERAGYEVIVFHATGSGGRAMEGLIDDGYIAGVADLTTTEWCDEVVGGVLSAGPERLSAAGRRGIPQVVSVGALDMVNFGAFESVPERFRERTFYRHNPQVTLMRTSAAECETIGRRIAEQLNRATGPTVLMLPLRGVSMIDAEGEPFHDPDANRALFGALREHIEPHVRVVDLDAHINDAAFAEAAAAELLALLPAGAPARGAEADPAEPHSIS